MSSVIGDILPLALGIMISPIPIIAAILMLLSPKAKGTTVGFLLGWVAGIVVALTVFILLAAVIPRADQEQSQPVAGVIKIILGALMVLLAVKQWRSRPKAGVEPALPTWMSAINGMTVGKSLGLGFLLSAVNPKNLLMAAGAGVVVGSAQLSGGEVVLAAVVFTVLAAASVAVPVIGYLLASQRLSQPLESLRGWLVHNNATVMAVLLLVIGITLVGKGIGSF